MSTVNLTKQTVNLTKGQTVNLTKHSEGLKDIMIGLGWAAATEDKVEVIKEHVKPGFIGKLFGQKEHDVERTVRHHSDGKTVDCDAWVAVGDARGLYGNDSVAYFGNLTLKRSGKVIINHHGDDLVGGGKGDNENIDVFLSKFPEEITRAVIGVTIYQARQKGQSFGLLKDTFVRVVDKNDNFEICRYNQAEMAENNGATTFVVGELYKENGEWQFKAIGKGTSDNDIGSAVRNYR